MSNRTHAWFQLNSMFSSNDALLCLSWRCSSHHRRRCCYHTIFQPLPSPLLWLFLSLSWTHFHHLCRLCGFLNFYYHNQTVVFKCQFQLKVHSWFEITTAHTYTHANLARMGTRKNTDTRIQKHLVDSTMQTLVTEIYSALVQHAGCKDRDGSQHHSKRPMIVTFFEIVQFRDGSQHHNKRVVIETSLEIIRIRDGSSQNIM